MNCRSRSLPPAVGLLALTVACSTPQLDEERLALEKERQKQCRNDRAVGCRPDAAGPDSPAPDTPTPPGAADAASPPGPVDASLPPGTPDAAVPQDASGSPTDASGDPQPVGQGDGWRLIFGDEFSGESLDPTKWTTCFPWGNPDTGCSTGTTPDTWYLPRNVFVGEGVVRLRALRESISSEQQSYAYTSGMISTSGFDGLSSYPLVFQYGYVEMRARLPYGQGLWPAFWTLAPDGEWPPEIDVFEVLGHEPSLITQSYHYLDSQGVQQSHINEWIGPDTAADFHVYGLSWEPTAIHWYVDGVEHVPPFLSPDAAAEPMYLITSLQVGGNWPGPPDETTPFPADLVIDYVRVWKK